MMEAVSATPAETKGEQTRAAILERAVDLASAEGLEGLTIGRLAAELEMSKSGLFAHFGSKQELQLAAGDARGLPRPRRRLRRRLLLGLDRGRVRRPAGSRPRRDRRRPRRLGRGA